MIDCKDKFFYTGDDLKIDDVNVFVQGQKHCLYVELKNGNGAVIKDEFHECNADPTDPNAWVECTNVPNLILKESIQESDFTEAKPKLIIPSNSGLDDVSIGKDIIYGNWSLFLSLTKIYCHPKLISTQGKDEDKNLAFGINYNLPDSSGCCGRRLYANSPT